MEEITKPKIETTKIETAQNQPPQADQPQGGVSGEPLASESVQDGDSLNDAMKNDAPQIIERSNYPSFGDLMAIVGVFIVSSLLFGGLSLLLTRFGSATKEFAMFVGYVLQFVVVITFALWQKSHRNPEAKIFSFSLRGVNPAVILWGVILTGAVSLLIEPIVMLFPDSHMEMLRDAVGTGFWAIMTTVVAAPILEEILFRGLIQRATVARWGAWRGVLIASAIFGAIHIIPAQAINAFFVAIVLGYVYVRSGSLLAVIVIHAINNAIAYLGMTMSDGKIESTQQMIGNDTIYYIVYGLAVVVFAVGVYEIVKTLGKGKDNNRVG